MKRNYNSLVASRKFYFPVPSIFKFLNLAPIHSTVINYSAGAVWSCPEFWAHGNLGANFGRKEIWAQAEIWAKAEI